MKNLKKILRSDLKTISGGKLPGGGASFECCCGNDSLGQFTSASACLLACELHTTPKN